MADPRKINLADIQGPIDAADSTEKAAVRSSLGLADAVIRVFHDDDASAARPDATYVEWVGSVEPENIENGDTFVNVGD